MYGKSNAVFKSHNLKESRSPVASKSKAWVCGRSLAGFALSNPAAGVDTSLL